MQLQDSRLIAAPPALVWEAIFSPEVLKACVPGCEQITGDREAGFEAAVTQKVGPVKARFTGLVRFEDIVEAESCTLIGEGKGGAAGFAKGQASITLTPEGDATRLTYNVEASVGGKLAQIGSRIIDGFAAKMADEFFTRFQEALEPAPEDDLAADTTDEPQEEQKKGWFKRLIS